MAEQDVPWDAAPHTLVKHDIYRRYFGKWLPIILQGRYPIATYAEGFSGPGVYKNGSPGSPVIAIRTLLNDPKLRVARNRGTVNFLFTDNDPRCIKLLNQKIDEATVPVERGDLRDHGIVIDVRQADCVPTLEQMLTEHNAWNSPMLVVLDTWGGSVPLHLIQRVSQSKSSEVLITIQPQYFARFAKADLVVHGDAVYGDATWREVQHLDSDEKTRFLIKHYRDTISASGFDYVLDFELIDNRGASLYLVFGTNHFRGLEKMKEAMWEVDEAGGTQYRDPRDPDQQMLDIAYEPHTGPLARQVLAFLAGRGEQGASVAELKNFALYKTVYKASHIKPLLDQLHQRGAIESSPSRDRVTHAGKVRIGSLAFSGHDKA